MNFYRIKREFFWARPFITVASLKLQCVYWICFHIIFMVSVFKAKATTRKNIFSIFISLDCEMCWIFCLFIGISFNTRRFNPSIIIIVTSDHLGLLHFFTRPLTLSLSHTRTHTLSLWHLAEIKWISLNVYVTNMTSWCQQSMFVDAIYGQN